MDGNQKRKVHIRYRVLKKGGQKKEGQWIHEASLPLSVQYKLFHAKSDEWTKNRAIDSGYVSYVHPITCHTRFLLPTLITCYNGDRDLSKPDLKEEPS